MKTVLTVGALMLTEQLCIRIPALKTIKTFHKTINRELVYKSNRKQKTISSPQLFFQTVGDAPSIECHSGWDGAFLYPSLQHVSQLASSIPTFRIRKVIYVRPVAESQAFLFTHNDVYFQQGIVRDNIKKTHLTLTVSTNVLLVFAASHDERQPKEWPETHNKDDNPNNGTHSKLFPHIRSTRMATKLAIMIDGSASKGWIHWGRRSSLSGRSCC
jgi:hypothetical protein